MLNSAADDFSHTTLAAVSGTLGKLQYLAGLRQVNGDYFHWGLARRHGEAGASVAIAQAHTDLFLHVLRTPLQVLWDEAQGLAQDQCTERTEYMSRLMEKGDLLVPAQLEGGARRHFNSVLLALCSLAGLQAQKADLAALR